MNLDSRDRPGEVEGAQASSSLRVSSLAQASLSAESGVCAACGVGLGLHWATCLRHLCSFRRLLSWAKLVCRLRVTRVLPRLKNENALVRETV